MARTVEVVEAVATSHGKPKMAPLTANPATAAVLRFRSIDSRLRDALIFLYSAELKLFIFKVFKEIFWSVVRKHCAPECQMQIHYFLVPPASIRKLCLPFIDSSSKLFPSLISSVETLIRASTLFALLWFGYRWYAILSSSFDSKVLAITFCFPWW